MQHAERDHLGDSKDLLAWDILDALPDPILLLDSARTIVSANRAALGLLGVGIEGSNLAMALRHPEVLGAADKILARTEEAVSGEITLPGQVQRVFQLQVSALPEKVAGGLGAIVLLHDVTATKAAAQMRADFVANVSHELRSPLASLLGFIETLRGPAHDDEEARDRFLQIMEGEAGRMTRLIGDLLALSKVEADEHVLPQGEVNLHDLVHGIADALSVRANERGVAIEIDAESGLLPVIGDSDELNTVFQNLLDNAISYGQENTTVLVTIRTVDRIPDQGGVGVSIAVHNEGEGISAEHLPRLTERFYRVDKGRSRSMGGTGLGLAIVKHMVNHHRGRLTVDSLPGQGVTFTVYLPTDGPGR